MYILDTDTLSNSLDKCRRFDKLRARIELTPPKDLWISAISLDEILRGSLDLIRRAQSQRRPTAPAYSLLSGLFQDLRAFQVLPFTASDESRYQAMPATLERAECNDCRIAATAIGLSYTVVTSNTRHFMLIFGTVFEDWTV